MRFLSKGRPLLLPSEKLSLSPKDYTFFKLTGHIIYFLKGHKPNGNNAEDGDKKAYDGGGLRESNQDWCHI